MAIIDRRALILGAATFAVAAGPSSAARVEEDSTSPVRGNWLPQGTNYNSSRSNRGRRPSLGTRLVLQSVPDRTVLFQGTTEPVRFAAQGADDAAGVLMLGGAAFRLPEDGPARRRFNLRINRLDRSISHFLAELGERNFPDNTGFGVWLDVGSARYEFLTPLRDIMADEQRLISRPLVIRGASGRPADPVNIWTFFDLGASASAGNAAADERGRN